MVDQSKGMRLLGQVICSPDTQVSSLITRIHHEQVMCVILFRENGRFLSVFNANHLMDKILFPMLLKSVYVVRIREDKFAEVYCATGDGSLWLVEISCSMGNSEFRIRRKPSQAVAAKPASGAVSIQPSFNGVGKENQPFPPSKKRPLPSPTLSSSSANSTSNPTRKRTRKDIYPRPTCSPSTCRLVSSNLPMGTLIHRSWDSCSILAAAPGVSKIISCPEAKSKKRDEALCHASPTSGPLTAVLAIRLRSLGKQSLSEDKEDADPTIAPILPPAAGRAVFGERLSSAGAEVVLEGGEEGRVWCKWRGEGEGDGGVAPKAFDVGERVAGIHYLRGRLSVKGSGVSLVEALLVVSQKGQTCVVASARGEVEHTQTGIPLPLGCLIESSCVIGSQLLITAGGGLYLCKIFRQNSDEKDKKTSNMDISQSEAEVKTTKPKALREEWLIIRQQLGYEALRVFNLGRENSEFFGILTRCGKVFISRVTDLSNDPRAAYSREILLHNRTLTTRTRSRPTTFGIDNLLSKLSSISTQAKGVREEIDRQNTCLATISEALEVARAARTVYQKLVKSAGERAAFEAGRERKGEGKGIARINSKVIWTDPLNTGTPRPKTLFLTIEIYPALLPPHRPPSLPSSRLVVSFETHGGPLGSKRRLQRISQPSHLLESRDSPLSPGAPESPRVFEFEIPLDGLMQTHAVSVSIVYDIREILVAAGIHSTLPNTLELTIGRTRLNLLEYCDAEAPGLPPADPAPSSEAEGARGGTQTSGLSGLQAMAAARRAREMTSYDAHKPNNSAHRIPLSSPSHPIQPLTPLSLHIPSYFPLMHARSTVYRQTALLEKRGGKQLSGHVCVKFLETLLHSIPEVDGNVGPALRSARCRLRVTAGGVTEAESEFLVNCDKGEKRSLLRLNVKHKREEICLHVEGRGVGLDAKEGEGRVFVALQTGVYERVQSYMLARRMGAEDVLGDTSELPPRDPEWASKWHSQVFKKRLPVVLVELKKTVQVIRSLLGESQALRGAHVDVFELFRKRSALQKRCAETFLRMRFGKGGGMLPL
ncbi:hypothetical protein AAMO2058_000714800 [Amorphochlora amoebiformis]